MTRDANRATRACRMPRVADVLAGVAGFAVEAVNGLLGRVAEVRRESDGTFLLVRRPSGREVLLPVGLIEGIDLVERRIRVYRSTREIDAAPSGEAALVSHYAPWGAGHRVLPAERTRQLITHVAERLEWEAATERGEYRPASLARKASSTRRPRTRRFCQRTCSTAGVRGSSCLESTRRASIRRSGGRSRSPPLRRSHTSMGR